MNVNFMIQEEIWPLAVRDYHSEGFTLSKVWERAL